MKLFKEIRRRFKVPAGGGRATDPSLTERRLVRMKKSTLRRLRRLAAGAGSEGYRVEPMQVAAVLVEKAVDDLARELGVYK